MVVALIVVIVHGHAGRIHRLVAWVCQGLMSIYLIKVSTVHVSHKLVASINMLVIMGLMMMQHVLAMAGMMAIVVVPLIISFVDVAIVVVMGLPHAHRAMAAMLRRGIFNLGSACLNLASLAIYHHVAIFTRGGSEKFGGIILQNKQVSGLTI